MNKSTETFKKKLQYLLEQGKTSLIDLHRKTALTRNSIYGYLRGASPNLRNLDKIAEAFDLKGWQMIQPEEEKSFPANILPIELINRIAKFEGEDRMRIIGSIGLLIQEYEEAPEKNFHVMPNDLFKNMMSYMVAAEYQLTHPKKKKKKDQS